MCGRFSVFLLPLFVATLYKTRSNCTSTFQLGCFRFSVSILTLIHVFIQLLFTMIFTYLYNNVLPFTHINGFILILKIKFGKFPKLNHSSISFNLRSSARFDSTLSLSLSFPPFFFSIDIIVSTGFVLFHFYGCFFDANTRRNLVHSASLKTAKCSRNRLS